MTTETQHKRKAKRRFAFALIALVTPALPLAGCSLLSFDDEEDQMDEEIQAQDRYIEINGLQIHYREWGRADAPPLLILHGLTGHAWEFDRVAAALADQYRVLAVNQRGHGASDWADAYAPDLMADDIAALVDALDLGRVRIIGHSMGGVNSWWFAARYPERLERLVITEVNPELITSDALAGAWLAALDAYADAEYADPEEAVTEYLTGYTGPHQEELRTFVLNNLEEGPDGRWTWRFDARGLKGWMEQASADQAAHEEAIRQIACPTLLIRAGDSPFTDAPAMERMAQLVPQARLVEIPGSGHDIHIDQFEALLAELQPFLAGE